jgi:hypothetical protein
MNNITLKDNLVFVNKETTRNVDFINDNDRFVSFGEGKIRKIRVPEFCLDCRDEVDTLIHKDVKYPLPIGEYFYYKISIEKLKKAELHIHETLSFLDGDDSIDEFLSLVYENNKFYENLLNYNKLIIISYLAASEDARKNNIIFSEFIKSFHDQHYSKDVMVLGYFKPIQYNKYFNAFVIKNEKIEIKDNKKSLSKFVPAEKFYNLPALSKSGDYEYDSLKMFSLAMKYEFFEIDRDKFIFQYLPKNR